MRNNVELQCSRRALLRAGALAGAGAAMAGTPFALFPAYAHDNMAWPQVEALVGDYVSSRRVANVVCAMGFEAADPRIIAQGSLALGGDDLAGPDSLYRIYSMTKPVTGMATMMLIDDGRLGMDQPLADILPAFADMRVQKTYDGGIGEDDLEPAARPITIRQLLTHTAGLGYSIIQTGPIADYYNENGIVPGQVTRLPIPQLNRAQPAPSLEAFADRLAQAPLVHQPGTRWRYSVSIDLLGRVIEVVSGVPFAQFLQDNLFTPTGMDSTYFRVPQSEAGRLTTNYGILEGRLLPLDPGQASVYLDDPAFAFGGAGLVSSPRDYDRFLSMVLNHGAIDGHRVMSERAVRVGTSNLLADDIDRAGTWIAGQGFGAGGRVSNEGGGHIYGWAGAAGTVGFVDFRSRLRAGLYTQYMPAEAYPMNREFGAAVLGDVAAAHEL